MKSYIVVIGDIEKSSQLSQDNRKEVQKTLESVFKKINRQSTDIISPYTITLGDEFQAVYQSAREMFKHIWTVIASIHPVNVRFSISAGKITTEINREHSLGMDGPAFHQARKHIVWMKEEKLLLSVTTEDGKFDKLVNNTFRILGANLRRWKKNRFIILQRLYEEKEVKQIAEEIGLSEVAIYKNINAGTLEAIQGLTDAISKTIDERL